jgi:hypothetical protein
MPSEYISKEIYYPIHDKVDSLMVKKLALFTLWFTIHEVYQPLFPEGGDIDNSLRYLSHTWIKINPNIVSVFVNDINYFLPLVSVDQIRKTYGIFRYMERNINKVILLLADPLIKVYKGGQATDSILFIIILTMGFNIIAEQCFGYNLKAISESSLIDA